MKGWVRLTALLLLQLTGTWAAELKIVRGMNKRVDNGRQLSKCEIIGPVGEIETSMLGHVQSQILGR